MSFDKNISGVPGGLIAIFPMELGPCENLFSESELGALITEVMICLKCTHKGWGYNSVEFMSTMLEALSSSPSTE